MTRTLAFCAAIALVTATSAKTARPVTYRVIALAEVERGQALHQGFVDAAMDWLQKKGTEEGFAVDYIRTTDPINEEFLAAHAVFIQLNYPPYRWTPVAEAAFKNAMSRGTIGWIGFHHASLLGTFDGFEMSPFFHEFMGNIVFKSYIPDFATGTVHVETPDHPVLEGLPRTFAIENDEWYTYDRSPRPDVQVLANVDETSYEPARTVKMGDHPVIWTNPALQSAQRLLPVRPQRRAVAGRPCHPDVPERHSLGCGTTVGLCARLRRPWDGTHARGWRSSQRSRCAPGGCRRPRRRQASSRR